MKEIVKGSIRSFPLSYFHPATPVIFLLILLLVSCLAVPSLSPGETAGSTEKNVPLWWPDTHKRGRAGGYDLITFKELQALIQSGKDFVLLDVRPDYEYKDGHIAGALNFEFHLGHRSNLEPERAETLKTLLGTDRDRLIVTYCRNFR